MDLLSDILSNPLLNGLGFILGVISIVLAFVFYKKSIRAKEPIWSIRSINLIRGFGSTIQDLEILYRKQEIENLTVSKVMFWNNGSETINYSDVATTNPLKLVATKDNIKILNAKALVTNNEASQFIVEPSKNEILFKFDYLDQGQGAIIQVFHTGTSSQDLNLKGTIKGVSKLRRTTIKQPLLPLPTPRSIDEKILKGIKPRVRLRIAIFIWLCFGVIALALGISVLFFSKTPLSDENKIAAIVFTSIYTLLGFMGAYVQSAKSVPNGLDDFLDDDSMNR